MLREEIFMANERKSQIHVDIPLTQGLLAELQSMPQGERLEKIKELIKAHVSEEDRPKLNKTTSNKTRLTFNGQTVSVGKVKAIDVLAEHFDKAIVPPSKEKDAAVFKIDIKPARIKEIAQKHENASDAKLAIRLYIRELCLREGCTDAVLNGNSLPIEHARTGRGIHPTGQSMLDSLTNFAWYTMAEGHSFEKESDYLQEMMDGESLKEATATSSPHTKGDSIDEYEISEGVDQIPEDEEEKEEDKDVVEEKTVFTQDEIDAVYQAFMDGTEPDETGWKILKSIGIDSIEALEASIPGFEGRSFKPGE